MKLLENKVVVITGGAGVLGAEMTRALAHQGAKLAIIGRDETKLNGIVNELTSLGGTAIGVSANVLDKAAVEAAHAQILEQLGPCDILINGAGGNHPKGTTSTEHLLPEHLDMTGLTTFFDLDPQGVEFVFNLNFLGTLIPTQVFAKDMVGRADCSVINISSMNAFTPLTKIPAYSGAKAAVSNFTQWLAVHFAKVGIRVNAIAPGFFLTDQNRALLTQADGSLTERGNKILSQTPMGRFGKPEDLNSTLLWLCDPASAFVTGVVIPVDGGFSAYSGV